MANKHYSMSNIRRIQIKEFTPYKDKVFVTDLEHGEKLTRGGLIVMDDNMKDRGIRPRWARVWAIGPDVKDLEVGHWILIEHGRWTQKITIEFDEGEVEIWGVEYPKSVIMSTEDDPRETAKVSHNRALEFATRKR